MIYDTQGRPVHVDIQTAYTAGLQGVGVSTVGNTAGNTGTVTGTVVLAGSNNVTLSQSTNASGGTIFIQLTGAGAADGVNIVSASGNTAGTLSSQSTGTVVLAGGANITLSQSSNTISIVGGAGGAGSVNFSAGTSSSNLTAVKFVDSNGVSFGIQTGSVITATVKTDYQSSGAYLTTAMQSACSSVFAKTGFTSASTAGTDIVGTLNTNGLSVGIPKYITTYAAQTVQPAVGLNTAQTNVTWTVNSSGISINAGGYAGSSTGTQSTTGSDIVLTHNTLGLNIGVPKYLTTAQPPGAYLTTARASNDAVGLNTAGTSVTWTVNSSGISLNAGAYLTTAQPPGAYLTTARASNDAVGLNTAQTNVTWTVNSSGLSLNASGYAGVGTSATNASITLNSNGLAISVAAPGGGGSYNIVSASGNTSGTLATFSSGTVVFAGGNNITLSQSSNSITISGANVGGAQTGISGLGNSATTFTSGSVILSEQANITIGSSLNGASQYLRFSVAAAPAQTNQAGTVYAGAGSYGTSSGTYDARTLSIAGAGAVSVAASNSGWIISAPAQSVQAAVGLNTAQTNVTWTVNSSGISLNAGGYAGSSTGTQSTGGSDLVMTHNTLGLNLGVPKWLTTYAAQTVQPAVGLNTAQTNVTWTVNSSGISLNASAYAGVSTGTQSTTGSDVVLTHNSLGLNLGVPKYLTTSAAQTNQSGNAYASSNTFGTSSGTFDARTISIAGSGAVSVAASNSGWVISAPVAMASNANTSFVGLGSAQTNVTWTYNSAGISLNAGGYAGTSTGFTGANISASMTNNTLGLALSLSVAAPGAAAENNWVNLSGNTQGNTTASGSTIKWYGGANITLAGTNGSEVSIIGGAGGGGAAVGLSTLGNTAGNTKTWTSGTVVLAGSNSLTISQSTDANGGTLFLQPAMSQLAAGNLISLSSNGSTISVIGLGAGTGTGFTGTNVSATITHNTAGLSLQLSAGGGGGGIAAGVSNTGNTAGNTGTYSTGTIVFAASNSMTLSQSSGAGSVHTIWMLPLLSALSGGGGISLSTTGSTIVIYTV